MKFSASIGDEMTSRLAQCRMGGIVFGVIDEKDQCVHCFACWGKTHGDKGMTRTQAEECEAVLVVERDGVTKSVLLEEDMKAKFLDLAFSNQVPRHEAPLESESAMPSMGTAVAVATSTVAAAILLIMWVCWLVGR